MHESFLHTPARSNLAYPVPMFGRFLVIYTTAPGSMLKEGCGLPLRIRQTRNDLEEELRGGGLGA
jgi:hypothetical protein